MPLSQVMVCTLDTTFSLLLRYGGKYTPLVGMGWSKLVMELATNCGALVCVLQNVKEE